MKTPHEVARREEAAREPAEATRTPGTPRIHATTADDGASENGEYVDARALSVRPAPLIEVNFPDVAVEGQAGRLAALLVLFVDRDGSVVQVDIEASTLPPRFEAAVKQVFLGTPFRPGLLDGRRVRSKLRVEVVLERVPVSAALPERASPLPAQIPRGI